MYFVEVILPLALAKTFTYSVSEAEYHYIQKGVYNARSNIKEADYIANMVRELLVQNKEQQKCPR